LEEQTTELCNQIVDEIIQSFVKDTTEQRCTEIFNVCTYIAKTAKTSCAKLEYQVVKMIVKEEARREYFSVLHTEILDDLLESVYFDACVKNAVMDFLTTNARNNTLGSEKCTKEVETPTPLENSNLELEEVDDIVKDETRYKFLNELCNKILQDLLDSHYFTLCVKVAVGDFMKSNSFTMDAHQSPTVLPTATQGGGEDTDEEQGMSTAHSSAGLLGSLKRKAVKYLGWSWPFKKQKKS